MTKVDGRYMIATEYRPLVNYDAWYRFKFDSGTIQNEAIRLRGTSRFGNEPSCFLAEILKGNRFSFAKHFSLCYKG